MERKTFPMERRKRIALLAHDNTKTDLVQWAKDNKERLANHELFATGSTGEQLEDELGFDVYTLLHGPLGGDLQIGGKISEGDIDFLIFFLDPLTPVSHDTDVQALMRMAVLWNIPLACNRASADFMIASALMDQEYQRLLTEEIDSYGSLYSPSCLEEAVWKVLGGRDGGLRSVPWRAGDTLLICPTTNGVAHQSASSPARSRVGTP
jgi:methylglyoxal synthase